MFSTHASQKAPLCVLSPTAATFLSTAPGFHSCFPSDRDAADHLDMTHVLLLQQMDTFCEVVDTLPHPYREVCEPMLASLVEKLEKATSTLVGLQAHQAKKTWLSQLLGHTVLAFQCSTEFEGTNVAQEFRQRMQAVNLHHKEEVLKEAITLKLAEITFLQQGLDITMWHKMLDDLVVCVYEDGPSKAMILVWTQPTTVPEGMQVEATISYVVDLTTDALFHQTQKELSYIGHVVLCTVWAKTDVVKAIATKKEGLKQKADPKLADPTPVAGPSGLYRKEIDDVVTKSVVKALKDTGHQAPKTSQHGLHTPSKNLGRGPPPKRDAAKVTTTLAAAGSSGGVKPSGGKRKVSGVDTSKAQKKKPKKN